MKFKFSHVRNQFISVACANLITLSHGALMGWMSPSLLVLQSPKSPLNSGELTTEEAAWLGSISYLGGFFGTFIFMQIINFCGRKFTFLILAIPNFVFWLTVIYSRDLVWLYVGRVIGGLAGGGMYIAVPLLVAEIADDNVRGILGSMLMIFACLGIMFAFVLGALVDYYTLPKIMIFCPVLLFLSHLLLPDTPMSLTLKKKKPATVEKSLMFFLNIRDTKTAENKKRFEEAKEVLHKMLEAGNKTKEKITYKDFVNKPALIGLVKGIILVFLSIFCGSPVLLNYSSVMFKNSGSDLDPSLCSIIMIIIQLVATTTSLLVVDQWGRRILLIVSSSGAAVGFVLMGAYTYLSYIGTNLDGFSWVPVTSISFAVLMAYIGLLPLVFIVLMEVLPPKIRNPVATFCLSLVSLFMFLVVRFYPIAAEKFQMHSCMWFFALVCVLGVVFGLILEETKGKDINAFDEETEKKVQISELSE